jgi:hypothetical protein
MHPISRPGAINLLKLRPLRQLITKTAKVCVNEKIETGLAGNA